MLLGSFEQRGGTNTITPALCPGAGNNMGVCSSSVQTGESSSLLAFPYLISLFFLVRPQSSVPDPKITSPSIEWRGLAFIAYPAPLGDPSPFSDPSVEELGVARPGRETMGLPEQDDNPPPATTLEQRRGREYGGVHPGAC